MRGSKASVLGGLRLPQALAQFGLNFRGLTRAQAKNRLVKPLP